MGACPLARRNRINACPRACRCRSPIAGMHMPSRPASDRRPNRLPPRRRPAYIRSSARTCRRRLPRARPCSSPSLGARPCSTATAIAPATPTFSLSAFSFRLSSELLSATPSSSGAGQHSCAIGPSPPSRASPAAVCNHRMCEICQLCTCLPVLMWPCAQPMPRHPPAHA